MSCAVVTKKDLEKFKEILKNRSISIEGIDEADLIAGLTSLTESKPPVIKENFTEEDIVKNADIINNKISEWRIESQKHQAKMQNLPEKSGKLGNASIVLNSRPKKQDPQNNKNSVFVTEYSAQAYNALNEQQIDIDDVINPDEGITIDTSSGTLMQVADTNGDVNNNVVAFVTRKNAQSKNGKWMSKDEVDKMIFNDSDLDAFKEANKRVVEKIKELTGRDEVEDVYLPQNIGMDIRNNEITAYLPEKFADELISIISNKTDGLGINAQKMKPDPDKDLFYIQLQLKNAQKQKNKKREANEKAAEESLKAKRPVDISANTIKIQENALKRQFPNIEERKSKVNLIAELFTRALDNIVGMYNNLESKTISGKRLEVLQITENGETIPFQILRAMKNFFNEYGELMDTNGHISEESVDKVIEELYKDPDTVFGEDYALESMSHDIKDKTLRDRARALIKFSSKISKVDGLFEGLVNAASDILAVNENIRLSIDKSKPELIGDQSNEMSEEDESADIRSEGYLVKQKTVDPKSTLTYGIKSRLGKLYKVNSFSVDDKGNKIPNYAYDELGLRTRISSGVAYYSILKRIAPVLLTMDGPKEFDEALKNLEDEFPWFIDMANEIRNDKDLRNQFFRGFCKSLVIYAEITPKARIAFKNLGMDEAALLDIVTKNYEGNNILTETSLYGIDGRIDMNNVAYFRNLINKSKTKESIEEIIEKHPLYWAYHILSPEASRLNIEQVKNVFKILKGEYVYADGQKNPNTSIENILKSIGIDTSDMNFNILLPNIDWNNINGIGDLDKAWSKVSRDKLFNILNSLHILVDKNYGLNKNSNLINNHRNNLLMMANSISDIADTYTQASFFYDGNSRYAYVAPDLISKIENILNNGSEEKVERFLNERYLKHDFFKNSPLLNQLLKDEEVRKKFKRLEVLDVNTGKGDSTIGKVSDRDLLTGLIYAFFNGGSTQHMKYGYVRNPLFSDSESLNLFKVPITRNYGDEFEDQIVDKLMTVAIAEIDRIIAEKANDDNEKVKIDNYNKGNKNASKFNFLPFLNNNYVIEKNGKPIGKPMSKSEAEKAIEVLKSNDKRSKYVVENEIISAYKQTKEIPEKMIREKIKEDLAKEYADFIKYLDELNINKKTLLNKIKNREVEESNEEKQANDEMLNKTIYVDEEYDDENNEDENGDNESEKETLERTDEEELNNYLKEFYYNDYYLQSQMVMLLGGDLAYYKNIRDFVKRNKQSYASGERIWAWNEDGTPMTERVVYLKDKVVISNTFQDIKELLEQSSLTKFEKEMMIGSLASLSKINSTDGFGLRTLKSFRKIFEAMGGMWNEEISNAFKNIMDGNFVLEDFVALVSQIKPFLFSYETKNINGRLEKVQVQHKNSEYLLSALFTSLNTALNKSPELKALQRFAELHDIDCFQFESVVKEGGFCPLDLNYATASYDGEGTFDSYLNEQKKALVNGKISQKEYNKILENYSFIESSESNTNKLEDIIRNKENLSSEEYIEKLKEYQRENPKDALVALELQMSNLTEMNSVHTLPLEDLMIAQPSADHLTDSKAIWGSQGKNIITADLSQEFETTMQFGGEDVHFNRKQTRGMFDTLTTDQILDANDKLDRDFKDPNRTKKMIESSMEGNPKYNGEIRKAFELNKDKTGFKTPINNPIMNNKGQELLLSPFKNNIQRMHINGGNAPIISNFALSHGMHDELHVVYKEVVDKKGKKHKVVHYIPCYLPAYYSRMYQDYLIEETDEHGNTMLYLDVEKMINNGVDEDLFKIIGYRIPTEDKYSMLPLKVIGFLPIQAGSSMMLPSDIVALTGGDFDIDKLFIMRKAFRREIASSDYGLEFIEWLKNNDKKPNKKFIERLVNITKDKNTGNEIYTSKKKGFTGEQLKYLYENYDDFSQFYDETSEHRYRHPKYTVLQPKLRYKNGELDVDATSLMKDVESKEMRKVLRDNMIIDLYYGILTSIEGSKMLMTPATYEFEKAASRQQIIKNDPVLLKAFIDKYSDEIKKYGSIYEALNNFGTITGNKNDAESLRKALDSFIEEYSIGDSPCDIVFWMKTHRNLMDGNGLIGGLAVNSSRHYKFQLFEDEKGNAGLKLNENNVFKIKIPKYGVCTISQIDPRISPITGKPIGKTNSGQQAASPDNGKEPCLGDLGINMRSLSSTAFMDSVGFDSNLIGFINRCLPVINEGYKLLGKRSDTNAKRRRFERTFKLSEFVMDVEKLDELHKRYILNGSKFDILDANDERFLKSLSLWWDNIKKCGRDLNECSIFVRSDSPNGALEVSATDVMVQLLKIEKLKSKIKSGEFAIGGLDKLIDFDLTMNDKSRDEFRNEILSKPIPRLQAYFTCGITDAVNLASKYIPEISKPMIDTILKLEHLTGRDFTKEKNLYFLRSFINDFTKYTLSAAAFLYSDDLVGERNFYINNFPQKYYELVNRKNSKGKYVYKSVRSMPLIRMLTNVSEKGIKFKNVGGKVSAESRQDYTDPLDTLLMGNSEVQQFGGDMFKYAYYDHGLQFGASNYGIFFSLDFLEALDGYMDALVDGNLKLLSDDTVFMEKYMMEFLLNNPKLIALAPKDDANVTYEDDIDILKINETGLSERDRAQICLVNNATGKLEYRKLIRSSHDDESSKSKKKRKIIDVYKLVDSSNPNELKYERIDYNPTDISFYDCNAESYDEIQWSDLKNRGVVVSLKNNKDKSDTEKSGEPTDGNPQAASKDNNSVTNVPSADANDITNIPSDTNEQQPQTAPESISNEPEKASEDIEYEPKVAPMNNANDREFNLIAPANNIFESNVVYLNNETEDYNPGTEDSASDLQQGTEGNKTQYETEKRQADNAENTGSGNGVFTVDYMNGFTSTATENVEILNGKETEEMCVNLANVNFEIK